MGPITPRPRGSPGRGRPAPGRRGRGARRRRPVACGGFSLIEIVVVIAIILTLMTMGIAQIRSAMERGRVMKCQKNLVEIGQALFAYQQRNNGRWPKDGGIRFLLTLHRHREVTGKAADIFVCPGTPNVRNDTGASGEPGSAYDDWEHLDSMTISYAGRDVDAFPLGNRDDEVIAADDNETGPNHRSATNILYADGSVEGFDLDIDGADLLAEYPELAETGLPVGPASPHEPLRAVRVD